LRLVFFGGTLVENAESYGHKDQV